MEDRNILTFSKLALLAAVSIFAFAAMIVFSTVRLHEVSGSLQVQIHETNLWAATQAEHEAQLLKLEISDPTNRWSDKRKKLAFDLLFSRLELMSDPPQIEFFRSIRVDVQLVRSQSILEELEQISNRYPTDRQALNAGLGELLTLLREISVQTMLSERSARFQLHARYLESIRILTASILGFLISGLLMVFVQIRSLREANRSRLQLLAHRTSLQEEIASQTQDLTEALSFERKAKAIYQSFILTISHQLKTPVSIIHLTAKRELRKADQLEDQSLALKLRKIVLTAERLDFLLTRFLCGDGILERADMPLVMSEVSVESIVVEVMEEIRLAIPDREFREVNAASHSMILADRFLIEQVLICLLDNAAKYSDPKFSVSFKTEIREDVVEFSVEDQGIGIPCGDQSRIFEKYFRGSNVAHQIGVGVGLHLAKEIVELHGGVMKFTSDPGQVTRFSLEIPRLKKHD